MDNAPPVVLPWRWSWQQQPLNWCRPICHTDNDGTKSQNISSATSCSASFKAIAYKELNRIQQMFDPFLVCFPTGAVVHTPGVLPLCRDVWVSAGMSKDGWREGGRGRAADIQKHWQQDGRELPSHQIVRFTAWGFHSLCSLHSHWLI